jgi:uncharacterized protein (DUF58 family)
MSQPLLARWWNGLDGPGWRSFLIAMAALALALLLALYSGAAAESGRLWLAGAAALAALALAGWVAVTIVPVLARRTTLRWFAHRIEYKVTREGWLYIAGVMTIALAALNTGNNLVFMILSSMLAGLLASGILSTISLTGVALGLELPEHLFARQSAMAHVELRNEKQTLPSFSLRVVGAERKKKLIGEEASILTRPVYFPYLPRRSAVTQKVELFFPHRGVFRQDALKLSTRFPFGFLQKARRVDAGIEAVVYPPIEPTEEFYEVLPLLSGELESYQKGRGHDLYSIRDHEPSDGARFVDWKASARSGSLKVREFTREDERRVVLVLDPFLCAGDAPGYLSPADAQDKFERAVTLCACLAWHFYQIDAVLAFRTGDASTPLAPAGETIYDILRHLALIESRPLEGGCGLLDQLLEETDLFKIILTSQPRGSIPTRLWGSSYLIFMQSL